LICIVTCLFHGVFESVVGVAFQSVFHPEMYENNVFFNLFLILAHQNDLKTLKFFLKKIKLKEKHYIYNGMSLKGF